MKRFFHWALLLFLIIPPLGSGLGMLFGASYVVDAFRVWGVSDEARYALGIVEVTAAVLIALPATTQVGIPIATSVLVFTMYMNISHGAADKAINELVVMLLYGVLFYIRHPARQAKAVTRSS